MVTYIPRKPPRPAELERRIHELAKDGAFSFEARVFAGGLEKGIDVNDALNVLMSGALNGDIEPGIEAGEWKCKIVASVDRSGRQLGVVTVVIKDLHLFVMAVEWEQT